MGRILKNLTTGRWQLKRLLGGAGADAITSAVTEAERATSAQIKVVIEASLDLGHLIRRETARERALELFGLERVWDTSANNGLLLYILVAERNAEIVADRGYNGLVSENDWKEVCNLITKEVGGGDFVGSIVRAVRRLGELAASSFPSTEHSNELSDQVRIR